MSGTIVLILFLLAFPALVLWLAERRIAFVHKISPVVVCYAAGLAVGNLGILPPSAAAVQENVNTITVVLAIPLLFFSLHIRGLARSGSRALLSFGLQMAAVLVISAAGFLLFHGAFGGEAAKVTGMLIGVYTGGTVNLAAIGTALRVDPSLYVAANASDILFSGLYLLLLMTVGKRLARLLLRRPAPAYGQPSGPGFVADSSFRGLLSRGVAGPLVAALALAAPKAAAGAGLTRVGAGARGRRGAGGGPPPRAAGARGARRFTHAGASGLIGHDRRYSGGYHTRYRGFLHQRRQAHPPDLRPRALLHPGLQPLGGNHGQPGYPDLFGSGRRGLGGAVHLRLGDPAHSPGCSVRHRCGHHDRYLGSRHLLAPLCPYDRRLAR